ncbi:MAG: peptidoglycan-binding protein [Acidimicrobiia bacterium]|nr:peptidoglycan-binding protein [Acidimicrobiia bacterium]
MLRNGSSGDEVMALQKSLAAMGINPGPADGIFGPKTAAAVKQFQEKAGLDADGIAGPKTMAAMAEAKGGGAKAMIADRAAEAKPAVEEVSSDARSGADSLKDKFADKFGAAREKAEDATESLKDKFSDKFGGGESDGPQ